MTVHEPTPAKAPDHERNAMSIAAVLNAAADHLDDMEQFRVDRDFKHGAGGAMFVLLYEIAKQLYGTTAIKHLERHLRGQLPHGQIQYWAEADRHVVAKTLREAAAAAPSTPEETP